MQRQGNNTKAFKHIDDDVDDEDDEENYDDIKGKFKDAFLD